MVSERAAINREGAGATVADMLRSVLPAELEPAVAGRMAPRRLGTLDDIAKVVALVASNDGRSRRIAASFNRLRATLSELRGYFR
jgi:hypothetical protein